MENVAVRRDDRRISLRLGSIKILMEIAIFNTIHHYLFERILTLKSQIIYLCYMQACNNIKLVSGFISKHRRYVLELWGLGLCDSYEKIMYKKFKMAMGGM